MHHDRTPGGFPHHLGRLVFPLILVPLIGCAQGGGDDPTFEVQTGDVVGELEVELPKGLSFILHGTLPIPPGTWLPENGMVPLAILDHDGKAVATQVETVSRYPSSLDGADVVELIARVSRPPGLIQYVMTPASDDS